MAPKKHYTPQQMSQAMKAVTRGLCVGIAAKKYRVPRTTLRNKVTGKSPAVCAMGPPTVLSVEEENLLRNWIFASAARHCPISKDQLLDSVQQIIINAKRPNPFTNNRPGKKWYYAFLRRHPDISERVAQNLVTSRDDVTQKPIFDWFSEIDDYLKMKGLRHILNDPKRVFNSDESAFFLNPKPGRVLTRRGEKNIYVTSSNEKENLTVLFTANAAGDLAPPMIVFAYERVPKKIADSIPDSYGIGKSETGWMCGDSFYEYMTNLFLPWLIENKITLPVILFLDGHRSHVTVHLSEFCSKNGIEVIALCPNSTHILQPMDIAIFRPLKMFWKNEARKWKMQNLGRQIKKENFAPILKAAIAEITTDCIKNGFKASGLCPFGPVYIDFSKLSATNLYVAERNEQVSLEQNAHFLKNLETEILKEFTHTKLDFFKKCFYMNRLDLERELPNEDLSLYLIWAKYKNLCVSMSSTTDTDHQNNNKTTQPNQVSSVNRSSELKADKQPPHKIEAAPSVPQNNTEITPVKCLPSNSNTEKTPVTCLSLSLSITSHTAINEKFVVPSPLKKALFWPEPIKKKGRIKKEKVPSATTSKAWKDYNAKKEFKKKTLEEEKEKRKLERLEKKKRIEEQKVLKRDVPKKKGCKLKKNNTDKKRKLSVSSDYALDSDVIYAESGESEMGGQSDESDFIVEYLDEDMLIEHMDVERIVNEETGLDKNKEGEIQEKEKENHQNKIVIINNDSVHTTLDEKTGKLILISSKKLGTSFF